MRLVTPTDFEVLEALSDGKRNVAANISQELNKDRGYVNSRMVMLKDYRLVDKIGPAANSGLYSITNKGLFVVHNQELYQQDQEEFAAIVSDRFSS